MYQDLQRRQFFAAGPYAVVGASSDRSKYGNKVLRAFLQNHLAVRPVNPHRSEVEGLAAYPDLASLPEPVAGIVVVTPPAVTEKIIEQAGKLGIKHVWLQLGAESELAVQRAATLGMNLISGGPCVLVALHYRE